MASTIKNSDKGGKKLGQKFKSLLVWQYLLKHTDEDHAASSEAIKEHLRDYGITADRHSIARDIDALNDLFAIDAAAEIDDRDRLNYEIIYDTSKRGYKIIGRPHDFEELRLLAECVRSSKFISKSQEEHMRSQRRTLPCTGTCLDQPANGCSGRHRRFRWNRWRQNG